MSPHREGSLQDKVLQNKWLARRAPGKSVASRETTGQWAWGRNMLAQLGHREEANVTLQVRILRPGRLGPGRI